MKTIEYLKNKGILKVGALLLLLLVLVVFQNCGKIDLQSVSQSQIIESYSDIIEGTLCYPKPVASDGKYQLANLYVVNMNMIRSSGVFHADSNQNGIEDIYENPISGETVQITNIDTDGDGVPDFLEQIRKFNPSVDDMDIDGIDADGVPNRQELKKFTDPENDDADEEFISVHINLMSEGTNGCGEGQPAYSFKVKKLPLMETDDFEDTQNQGLFSLTHTKDQNNILVLSHLIPDNSTKEPVFLASLVKMSVIQPSPRKIQPHQFRILTDTPEPPGGGGTLNGVLFQSVSTGKNHSCAISTNKKLYCWGANSSGQLGIDSTLSQLIPTEVEGLSNVKSVEVGYQHTCATTDDNFLYCWGSNSHGQLGLGGSSFQQRPQRVTKNLSFVEKISLGDFHTCVEKKSSQEVYCWGANQYGQLGLGTISAKEMEPKKVILNGTILPLKSLSSGGNYNCLVDKNSKGYCWGGLKNGGSYCSQSNLNSFPITACGQTFGNSDTWSNLVTNGYEILGVNTNGWVSWMDIDGYKVTKLIPGEFWDTPLSPRYIEKPQTPSKIISNNFINLSDTSFACITTYLNPSSPTTSDYRMSCFVDASTGFQEVSAVGTPRSMRFSGNSRCIVNTDGALFCWGENSEGQLGTGDYENQPDPIRINP